MLEYSDLEVPGMERIPIPGIQARLSKTPGKVVTRAPRVGEHNQEIYQELLGYQDDFMDKMTEQRII